MFFYFEKCFSVKYLSKSVSVIFDVFSFQESTFLYDENPAAVVSKEINHDVLYREGRTMTVSINTRTAPTSFLLIH